MGIRTCSQVEAPWGTCALRCGPEGSAVILEKSGLIGTSFPLCQTPRFLFHGRPALVGSPCVHGRAGVLLHLRCGHVSGVTILLSQFTKDALGYICHQSFFFFSLFY